MDNSTFIILAVVSLLLNLTIGVFVANAAQRKGRSWAAFFWLSVVAGWLIMAIVVAAIAPTSPNNPITNEVGAVPKKSSAGPLQAGISLMVLGLIWIFTYYLTEAQFPLGVATRPFDLGNWNILVGLFFVILGYVLSNVGLGNKSRK